MQDNKVLFSKEFIIFRDESYAEGKIYRFFFDRAFQCQENHKYTLSVEAK